MTWSPIGQTRPGAVPGICSMGVAPSGTSAWRRLLGAISRPRFLEHLPNMLHDSVTPDQLRPHDLGDGFAGDVVLGGAQPPAADHGVGAGECQAEAFDHARLVVAHFCLVVRINACQVPVRSPIQEELVSTIWPSSSSVPMANISQRIFFPCGTALC